MNIDEILKLVNAGYSKEEIASFETTNEQKTKQKQEQTQEQKQEQKNDGSFDYEKFATAFVKAQQLANGKTNFGWSNDKPDISKFF